MPKGNSFKDNPELAREAGRKGGEALKAKIASQDPEFFRRIGREGGETVKRSRGSEFYAEIGRKGGIGRGIAAARAREEKAERIRTGLDPMPPPRRPRGRPRKDA